MRRVYTPLHRAGGKGEVLLQAPCSISEGWLSAALVLLTTIGSRERISPAL